MNSGRQIINAGAGLTRFSVLGCHLALTTLSQVMAVLDRLAMLKKSRQVCICNVHSVITATRDPEFRTIINSSAIAVMDGLPLVWTARLSGGRYGKRIAGPDVMDAVCRHSTQRGYRHYFYGGNAGVADNLRKLFEKRYPGIQITGTYSPPFRELSKEEERHVMNDINLAEPHFLWVGLGAPKQEKWIFRHLDRIHVPVQIGVGAAFDFLSGNIQRAPAWMQSNGLEWFHRLMMDPKRLWKRYLWTNTLFLLRVIPEIIQNRQFGNRLKKTTK